MCQAKPGPRCTAHARRNLEWSRQMLQEAEDKLQEHVRKGLPGDGRVRDADGEYLPNLTDLSRRVTHAQTEVDKAVTAWHETPGGMEELNAEYKAARTEGRHADAEKIKAEFQRGDAARERSRFLQAATNEQSVTTRNIEDVIANSSLDGRYIQHIVRGEVGAQKNIVYIGALSGVSARRMREALDMKGLRNVEIESARVDDRKPQTVPDDDFQIWNGEA